MRDFDAWYEDAKKRHTGLFGVDHAAIRAEFRERQAARQAASERRSVMWLKCILAAWVTALALLVWLSN